MRRALFVALLALTAHAVRLPTNIARPPSLLLDPLELKCCAAQLEQHPELGLPRLVLRARPAKIEQVELEQMTHLLRATLDRRVPFTVLWDLRKMRPPSRDALRFGIDWMGADVNAQPTDELVQSTVIIASSPVVRAICGWILKVCRPPRPVEICSDDAAALAAACALERAVHSDSKGGRTGKLVCMCTSPSDDDAELEIDLEIELDDISNLLESMDIAAEADMEAATAWEASQLSSELAGDFDVEELKRSLSALKQEERLADQAGWKEAFGEEAEITDVGDANLELLEDGNDDFEFVTL